jgi:hypothetical protein
MSVIDQAKYEMKLANFPADEIEAMTSILDRFFDTWDSGGAVWVMAPVLQKLIAAKPLSPLTGEDHEWVDHGDGVFQNRRCGSVFKDPRFHDGKLAYDIDAPEPRAAISFPYTPESNRVRSPVIEI